MKKYLKSAICVLLAMAMIVSAFVTMPLTLEAEEQLPSKFDLRDLDVVTSVKKQDPWNSCWAFSGIAASEISILTSLGMTNEEYKARNGGKELDFSEKHLAWFASRPITEATDPKQAGEGLVQMMNDPHAVYRIGGFPLFVTTLFSAGVGPVFEQFFPYQGKEGLSEKQYLEIYPEARKAMGRETVEKQLDMTLEEALQNKEDPEVKNVLDTLYKEGYLDKSDTLTTESLEEAAGYYYYDNFAVNNSYTKLDDWTIPDVNEEGYANRDITSGYTLVDGNILPSLAIKKDGKWEDINEEGITAVKKELMKGRGVSAGFKADQASPGDPITDDSYINVDTWAHYTHKDDEQSHAICIVGWDDDYPRENFNSMHMPPKNGAWIVKNSWGSEIDYTDGQIGYNKWGIKDENGKHTGYFYISYYDKTLNNCETLVYDTDLDQDGKLGVWMYDYLPAMTKLDEDTTVQDDKLIKTANVFYNDTGEDCRLFAVSSITAQPNATVKYFIYRLKQNAQNPEDGELIKAMDPVQYEYAGFHRQKLDGSITIGKGETLGIVVEETVEDKTDGTLYEYSVNAAPTEEAAQKAGSPVYGVAVVNKGESFIYENDKWTDWSEYEKRTAAADQYVIDNFSIKAYMIAQDTPDQDTPAQKNITDCTVSGITAKTYNGKAQTQNITVKDAATTLKEGTDYTVSYKNNQNAGTATMTITGKGNYKGTITKTFLIDKADNTMTVKVKKIKVKPNKNTSFKRTKVFKLKTAKGKVTFMKIKGKKKKDNKKITISEKGKLTVKKGLKKGKTYTVKVKVTASGNENYKEKSTIVNLKIKVKR